VEEPVVELASIASGSPVVAETRTIRKLKRPSIVE
jgi:hypothetical protein